MAFTGAPVVKLVSDRLVRITGVSLGAGAVGVIGLFGSGLEVELPDGFNPQPYTLVEQLVTLLDSVQCWYVNTDPGGGGESRHIHVGKSEPPFAITYTNDGAQATSPLEIYVAFH